MDLLEELAGRLGALGVSLGEADGPGLAGALERAEQRIKNHCNLSRVPEALKWAWIDLAAADYLWARGAAAGEKGEEGDGAFERAVKSVQEGDTTVTFLTREEGGTTPEARMEGLVSQLREGALEQLLPFRRLKW